MKPALLLSVLLAAAASSGCIHRYHKMEVAPVTPQEGLTVRSAVRAHLLDGEAVVFPEGVRVEADTLRGRGVRWTADRRSSFAVTLLPLHDVVGMESYRSEVNGVTSGLVSAFATIAIPVGAVVLACIADPKCFGSCPTFYVEEANGAYALLAEGFSFSIAPLLEMRDVDRLPITARADGVVRLELRNEALETHYINHIELLAAQHPAGTRVMPDARGRPLAVADEQPPTRATDRSGRIVSEQLAEVDENTYATSQQVLDASGAADLFDHVELVFPPRDADSVALVFRMRNSLLTTVLLYELMLAEPGARAIDWHEELQALGPAMQLVRWYAERMGMHVDVFRDGAYLPVARIGDTGPIAWNDVAVNIPATRGDSVRVRLRFIADQWRIDQVVVASSLPVEVTALPLHAIIDAAGSTREDRRQRLLHADEAYLEALPGDRFTLDFDAGTADAPHERTFLLATQGFYQEWVRQGWLREPRSGEVFVPGDDTMAEALRRYRAMKPELEERFFATRIPVR
jgi:hypothetical protein